MRFYKKNGVTVAHTDELGQHVGVAYSTINPDGLVSVKVGGQAFPPLLFEEVFKEDGTTPIGTDVASSQLYLVDNTVFSSAPGGSGALAIGSPITGGTTNNLLRVVSGGLLGQVDPATLVIPTTGVAVSDVASPTGNLAQSQKGVYDFSQSKAIVNQLIDDVDQNIRTVFNGTNTTGTVGTPLVISAVGDYIEFELKCNLFNSTTQRGIMGQVGTGNSSIGIGTASGNLRMRSTSGAWFNSTNILNDNLTASERPIIRVENVAGVWKSYKNGVFQKNLTEGGASFTLASFGNAYDTGDRFNGELSKVKGKAGGIDFDFGSLINSPLVVLSNAVADMSVDGFLTTTQTANLADTLVDYAPCFYEIIYNTGGTVFEAIMVYMKIKGKNKYMGTKIERRITPAVKQDIYKILNSFEYTYNPTLNTMTLNSAVRFIEDGESEFVYKITGAGGGQFTGGGHGYETLTKALFYAGGVPIAINVAKTLTRCENFEYVQESTTWNAITPAQADGTHIKFTRFIPSQKKIETRNIMTWARTITLELWYHGIFCLGKGVATKVRNEFFEQLDTPALMVEVNPAFQSTRAFELIGNNDVTGYSGRVKSTIKRPLTMAQSTVSDMFIAIRLNDTKFYNKVTGSVVNGDVWENVQESYFETI